MLKPNANCGRKKAALYDFGQAFSSSQGKLTVQYRNLKNPAHTLSLYTKINSLIKNSALTKTSTALSATELKHIFKLVNFAWK